MYEEIKEQYKKIQEKYFAVKELEKLEDIILEDINISIHQEESYVNKEREFSFKIMGSKHEDKFDYKFKRDDIFQHHLREAIEEYRNYLIDLVEDEDSTPRKKK